MQDSNGCKPVPLTDNAMQALLESAAEGIVLVNREGRIALLNARIEEIFGYGRSELLGQPVHLLVPERLQGVHSDHCQGFFRNLRQRRMGQGLDLSGRRKDGTELPVEISLSCVDTGDGVLAMCFVTDITARKQAEDKLRDALAELELQYRAVDHTRSQANAILNATSDAIVLISPDYQILSVNRTFYRLFFGDRGVEVTGRQFTDFEEQIDQIFPEAAKFRAMILDTVTDPESEFQQVVTQHWPQQRVLQVYSAPIHSVEGEHLGRLYAFRDVTYEREVDRMKTEFVSLVSHELRTPLTSIKGFVDLIIDGDAGEVNEEQEEYLGIVKQNVDRLVALINDLLDISRIESGRIQLKMQPVRVDDLIQVVTLTLGPQVREKSQTLAVKLEPDLPPILGDRDRLLQLLTNLVSNAYKYTLPGGDIGIEARQDDGWLDVSVSDTGVGISPEDQEKLFTRFFRVDSSLTSEIGGTGLGLTIVKSIAELHSGSVSLVSELGKGSTFTVRLPVAEGLEEPGLPPGHEDRPATPAPQGHRILVVEDDPDVARLIRRYLERAGYLVETVLSAEEALQRIEQQCPDLITLDINLPGMDGFELAERLAARPDTREIPILVVSIVHDGAREVSFGLVGALPKPIDQQQLVSTIGEALGDSQKGQVLVVDDDPGVRKLLGVALEKQGFEVLEAEDGASALELAQQKRPGLVLLDLGLPKIDGSDVLQQLKENPDTAELPVVVISGSESLKGGARARVLALGAADFLTKPFDLDELISEVRILIEGG